MEHGALARWRMHNLLLWSPAASPGAVIAQLGASQGQDFLPGLWSVAQRTAGLTTYDEVAAAFDRGEILRTHVLRPTWHLVAPADLGMLLAATAPRVHQLNAHYNRQLGIDEQVMVDVRRTLELLLPGRHLTRSELGESLRASGQRLGYLMMWAELEGWVCSGARSGNQQTYALLDERAPAARPSHEEALHDLAHRYFTTRGPATVRDLAGWASLTLAQARAARASLDGFDDFDVDGRTYVVRGDLPPASDRPRVDLVQSYDECIMSYSESRDVLSPGHRWTEVPPSTYVHAILVDGHLVGHWRYERDGRGRPDTVQTFTYRPLSGPEKESLEQAVAGFRGFARS